ncbi:GNAT family N-acetyltransferase [Rhodococcus sp. I2R]|nr:GNAT family N-acetyltransferase [Rhodococcus sp. I2R]
MTLRHAAEDWLRARGIDQWTPREVPLTVIEKQVLRGEFFVARNSRSAQIIGAVRLIWSDPEIWGESAVRAAYVHGLVIDRSLVGVGLGRDLLTWAARHARDEGAETLRLDCAETNPALRRYYRNFGFSEVGVRDLGRFEVVLFEKFLR